MAHEFAPVTIEELRTHNDVAHAGFVFETQKHKSFGRTWTLPHDYPAGDTHEITIAQLANVDRAQGFQALQFFPVISHRMFSDRQSSAAKISVYSFG